MSAWRKGLCVLKNILLCVWLVALLFFTYAMLIGHQFDVPGDYDLGIVNLSETDVTFEKTFCVCHRRVKYPGFEFWYDKHESWPDGLVFQMMVVRCSTGEEVFNQRIDCDAAKEKKQNRAGFEVSFGPMYGSDALNDLRLSNLNMQIQPHEEYKVSVKVLNPAGKHMCAKLTLSYICKGPLYWKCACSEKQ